MQNSTPVNAAASNPAERVQFVTLAGPLAWFSVGAVLFSVIALGLFGLNFGIDFVGGNELQLKFAQRVTGAQIRAAIAPLRLGDARVQQLGQDEQNAFLLLLPRQTLLTDKQRQTLFERLKVLAPNTPNAPSAQADTATQQVRMQIAQSGQSLRVSFPAFVDTAQLEQIFVDMGLSVHSIEKNKRADKPTYTVRLVSIVNKVEQRLRAQFAVPKDTKLVQSSAFVGPQVGQQLRNQGLMALFFSLVFILLYVAMRFDLSFAPGAVLALVHDVLITLGLFAVAQIEFNLPIVAAVLALVGYSLNDTIVVYDRIRENQSRYRVLSLARIVNISLNQTLSRTLLTSCTTLLVVVALLLFGGQVIRPFSWALLIGVVAGTYSSVFIASPLFLYLQLRSKNNQNTQPSSNRGLRS